MFQDPEYIKSHVNLFIASNRVFGMVPATDKSRRFEMYWSDFGAYFPSVNTLDLYWTHPVMQNEIFAGQISKDSEYFKILYTGGRASEEEFLMTLANLLYHVPLDGWNADRAMDSYLLDQNRKTNMGWAQKYTIHILKEKTNDPFNKGPWCQWVPVADLWNDLIDFAGCENKKTGPKGCNKPTFQETLCRYLGITVVDKDDGTPAHRKIPQFRFNSFEECKGFFIAKTGMKNLVESSSASTDKENQDPNVDADSITSDYMKESTIRKNWLKNLTAEEYRYGFIPKCWRGANPLEVSFSLAREESGNSAPNTPAESPDSSAKSLKRKVAELDL